MVLSDRTIRRLLDEGRIEIDPYDPELLQPSSVDVRVDRYFRVFHNARYPFIDVKQPQEELTELVEIAGDSPFILHPGEFVLGSTLERIKLPDDLVARLEGKSSLGRLGLLIHSTAGFIDPGWDGHVTLELSNVANLPITIYYGMKIGQLSFVQLTEPAEAPYGSAGLGSKYQGQKGPTPSAYWRNFAGGRLVKILVTGGYGFVGPKIVHALRARDHDVRALVRDRGRAKTLESWGCELVDGDVTDPESLRRAAEGVECVVHLVAMIKGSPEEFERVMAQGTRDLVAAAEAAGARRIVLMSALGTSERNRELVPYYRAKWDMEQAVKASALEHVIFRPSFVFGQDGGVLPMFVRQVRLSPVTPVVGDGEGRLQPIWVDDVASFFAEGVDSRRRGRADVRARRARRGHLERALRAHSPGARRPAGDDAHPRLAHALRRDAHRLAALCADHPRPAEDARRGRRPGLRSLTGHRDASRHPDGPERAAPPSRLTTRLHPSTKTRPASCSAAGFLRASHSPTTTPTTIPPSMYQFAQRTG